MSFTPGAFVTDDLRLERPSSRDPSGGSWYARDTAAGRDVMVKLLLPGRVIEDPHALRRFEREARLGARFSSERIVRVLAHGMGKGGTPFIATERIAGEHLAARLRRGGRLSPEAVARVVSELAHALSEVHAAGVVHRDVAAHHVWLEARGSALRAKLGGFGLARVLSEDGQNEGATADELEGTPAYLSPERIVQRPLGRDCDLWGLAVIAYEGLTGALPFEGDAPARVFAAVLQGRFVPATHRAPNLSRQVDAFFSRAFARELGERFSAPVEMAEAFAIAIAPPRRPQPTPPERLPARTPTASLAPAPAALPVSRTALQRRRHELAAAIAIGVAVGLLGVVLYRTYAHRPPPAGVRLKPYVSE